MANMKKKAQSLIEYGLILALVAVVAVVILGKFSTTMNNVGNQANSAVSNAAGDALCGTCNGYTGQDLTDCKDRLKKSGITCP